MKEILIIKTDQGEKIKNLLDQEQINYQIIYDDILVDQELDKEKKWRLDSRLASQDKEREAEIKE
jgi:hypothetical protein